LELLELLFYLFPPVRDTGFRREHRAFNRPRAFVTPECASAHIRGIYKTKTLFVIPTTKASFRDDDSG